MKPESQQAIQVLRDRIRAKEEEALTLKRAINGIYADENEPVPYPDAASDVSTSLANLRTDHFYGSTMADAAKEYLEMRKAAGLGSASINEIYDALKAGGYDFNTANEDYAKNGVRISLKKQSAIFHKLPGGDYGLCLWYGVKGHKELSHTPHKRGSKRRKRGDVATSKKATGSPKADQLKPEPIDPNAAKKIKRQEDAFVKTANGVITVQQLQDFIRHKNRRMNEVTAHFGVDKPTIQKLLEPASAVYEAERGWLKVRE